MEKNTYRLEFSRRKEQVINLMTELMIFAGQTGYPELADTVSEVRDNLIKERFVIVVAGEFSAGKSTFLNALMGQKILPSRPDPTTATLNFLYHAQVNPERRGMAEVHFFEPLPPGEDTNPKVVPMDKLEEYVDTRSNIDVSSKVERVDIFIDNKFLQDGVMFVDTPGDGSPNLLHKQIAYEQVTKSSACIFLINGMKPGGKVEIEFLQDIRKHIEKVILVLNQVDNINTQELSIEDIVTGLKKTLSEHLPGLNTEITPLSAAKALVARNPESLTYRNEYPDEARKALFEQESNILELERRLWQFLTQGEKANLMLSDPLHKCYITEQSITRDLEQRLDVLSKGQAGLEELKQEKAVLEARATALEAEKEQRRRDFESKVYLFQKDRLHELKNRSDNLRERLINLVEQLTVDDDPEEAATSLQRRIRSEFERLRRESVEDINQDLETMIYELQVEDTTAFSELFRQAARSQEVKSEPELDLVHFTVNVNNLVESDKIIQAYEAELTKYQEEMEQVQLAQIDAIQKKCQMELLEHARDRLMEHRTNDLGIFGNRPPVVLYQEEEAQERSRGGVLGFFTQILVGPKIERVVVNHRDDGATRTYDANMAKINSQYEGKIDSLDIQLEEKFKSHPEAALARHKLRESHIKQIITKREEDIRIQKAKYDEVRAKRHRKELANLKGLASEAIEEIKESWQRYFEGLLRSLPRQMAAQASDLLASDLNARLANEVDRIVQIELSIGRNEEEQLKQKESYENNLSLTRAMSARIQGLLQEIKVREE